jgi:hypothetical protein
MWSDSPGWMKQRWLYDGEEGVGVGRWMEFCGDGGMECSCEDGWSGVGYLVNNKDRNIIYSKKIFQTNY